MEIPFTSSKDLAYLTLPLEAYLFFPLGIIIYAIDIAKSIISL